jgi:hypothetical protein
VSSARCESCASWDEFARSNLDLFESISTILNRHYRPSTWQSEAAKARFFLPDGTGRSSD